VYKGTVKWFDNLSGCGVLERESGEEISIHVSAMRNSETKTLRKGEMVLFDIGRGRKGIEAIYAMMPGRNASIDSGSVIGLETAVQSWF